MHYIYTYTPCTHKYICLRIYLHIYIYIMKHKRLHKRSGGWGCWLGFEEIELTLLKILKDTAAL